MSYQEGIPALFLISKNIYKKFIIYILLHSVSKSYISYFCAVWWDLQGDFCVIL